MPAEQFIRKAEEQMEADLSILNELADNTRQSFNGR